MKMITIGSGANSPIEIPFIPEWIVDAGPDEKRRALRELPEVELSHALWTPRPRGLKVTVRLAHDGRRLMILYAVIEPATRAKYTRDQDPVYTDSCVEFFFAPGPGRPYCNFEWNAIGTMLASCGVSRRNRRRLDQNDLARVERIPSLGREPIELRTRLNSWELLVTIPADLIAAIGDAAPLSGCQIIANFCKCGDELPEPHYLSCAWIDTVRPDFHRPEFFRPVKFR